MNRPYTPASAQIVDHGRTITVLYIPDAEHAKDPRHVLDNLDDLRYQGVEVIAEATRYYKSEGATVSGWVMSEGTNTAFGSKPNKRETLAYFREHSIPGYFPTPEVRAAALETISTPQEQQAACLHPSGCSSAPVGTVRATRRDTAEAGVVGQYCSEHLAHPAATFPDAYTFEYLTLDAQGPIATEHLDAPATLAAPQAPVKVHVAWTHREGTRITGIMNFSLSAAEEAVTGREPQFLITGGTRRVNMTAFSDYDTADQFGEGGRLEVVVARAAAWLGLEGRELAITVDREYLRI